MMLSDVCLTSDIWRMTSVCLSRTSVKSRTERPRKTKIGAEVAQVTTDSDTTFKVKRSKVKVTRLLCSPSCWRVRRLQRWAWERVGRGKLLLRCRLLGGARRFGTQGRRGAVAYRGGRLPTAGYASAPWGGGIKRCFCLTSVWCLTSVCLSDVCRVHRA